MKRLALFVIFLMSISMVSAEFNRDSAVGWLKGEVDNKWSSLGNDMEKISFSVLALNLNGEDETAILMGTATLKIQLLLRLL